MKNLDLEAIAKAIAGAMLGSLRKDVPGLRDYATTEAQKIASTFALIAQMRRGKKIDKQTAAMLVDMQKHASRAVLLTIEGLGVLAVEKAINAALAVVRDAVNKALGFALL
jgi:hypothetical protein